MVTPRDQENVLWASDCFLGSYHFDIKPNKTKSAWSFYFSIYSVYCCCRASYDFLGCNHFDIKPNITKSACWLSNLFTTYCILLLLGFRLLPRILSFYIKPNITKLAWLSNFFNLFFISARLAGKTNGDCLS